jgi:hypothetical protein
VMLGVEHDEAISIYALPMQARRLLRRPATAGLLAMTIPRFFNSPTKGNPVLHFVGICCLVLYQFAIINQGL